MNSTRVLLLAALFAGLAFGQGPTLAGCPKFPANNIWNAAVDALPVHPHSADYIANISATGGLRYDISIPVNIVPGTQPKVTMNFGSGESDPGPYPFPPNALVEGGSDAHVLVVDKDNCMLYETFNSSVNPDGSWNADIGAKWSLLSNALRPDGWSSADAAGLPIMPGLLLYDEMVAGAINHALRFTAPHTQRLYVWPGRHYASSNTSAVLPPMGQRFRLKAGFDISGYSANMQVVLRALKKYGLMLADNGLPWEMQASLDTRWNEDDLLTLRQVIGSNLEAVDVSGLMVNPDSGQAGSACTVSFAPTAYADSAAQTVTIDIQADVGCAWQASGASGWLTLASGAAMSGSGAVGVNVAANSTGAPRSAALTVGVSTLTVVQRQTARRFVDVPPADDFFDAINLMQQLSITKGCQALPAAYCPDDTLTRGAAAVFIVRSVMGGDNFPFNALPYFTDVPATHPYFQWIQKLRELGITSGCSAAQFCPGDPITRGQIAVFIIRARLGSTTVFDYPATPLFTDVPATHPYFAWIQKMKQIGITAGCTATTYCPDDPLTRRGAAVFVLRGEVNDFLPAGTPVVASVAPAAAAAGQTVTVAIVGTNTNFAAGVTKVDAGAAIAVYNTTVLSVTSLTADLTVAGNASPGPRSITVKTGSEEATLPNGFRIQ